MEKHKDAPPPQASTSDDAPPPYQSTDGCLFTIVDLKKEQPPSIFDLPHQLTLNKEHVLAFRQGSERVRYSYSRKSLSKITLEPLTTLKAVNFLFLGELLAQSLPDLRELDVSTPGPFPSVGSSNEFHYPNLIKFHLKVVGYDVSPTLGEDLLGFLYNCPRLEYASFCCPNGIIDLKTKSKEVSLNHLRSLTYESHVSPMPVDLFNQLHLPPTCDVTFTTNDVPHGRSLFRKFSDWSLPALHDSSYLFDVKEVAIIVCSPRLVVNLSNSKRTVSLNSWGHLDPTKTASTILDVLKSRRVAGSAHTLLLKHCLHGPAAKGVLDRVKDIAALGKAALKTVTLVIKDREELDAMCKGLIEGLRKYVVVKVVNDVDVDVESPVRSMTDDSCTIYYGELSLRDWPHQLQFNEKRTFGFRATGSEVKLFSYEQNILASDRLTALRAVNLRLPRNWETNFLDFLRNCPGLEVVYFAHNNREDAPIDITTVDATDKVNLSHLRSFTYESPVCPTPLGLFNQLCLPPTCNITFMINDRQCGREGEPLARNFPIMHDPSHFHGIKKVEITAQISPLWIADTLLIGARFVNSERYILLNRLAPGRDISSRPARVLCKILDAFRRGNMFSSVETLCLRHCLDGPSWSNVFFCLVNCTVWRSYHHNPLTTVTLDVKYYDDEGEEKSSLDHYIKFLKPTVSQLEIEGESR